MASSSFQTFILGADQAIGQHLSRQLKSQGLMYKNIALGSRDKLPTTTAGRPFFVIIPALHKKDDIQHALYWLERAQEMDAAVVVISSTALFAYQAETQVDETTEHWAASDVARDLQQLEQHCRHNERHVILRVGEQVTFQGEDFASRVLLEARQQAVVDLDMQRLFDPTPAADIADVLLAIIRQLVCSDELFGTYHFSGVEAVSAFSFAEVLLAQAGQYEDLSQTELRSQQGGLMPEIWCMSSDNTLLFHTFGIKQKAWRQTLSDSLKRYYRTDNCDAES